MVILHRIVQLGPGVKAIIKTMIRFHCIHKVFNPIFAWSEEEYHIYLLAELFEITITMLN